MSVVLSWALQATVNETLEANVPAASSPVIVHDQFNAGGTLNASSTVPVSVVVADTIALVAGAKTIDLTALTGTNDLAIDLTGKKVQVFKIKNRTGNSPMTFKFGAANPYDLLGASWQVILEAEQELMVYLNESADDVGATDKTIDVAGTGTEQFDMILVAG